MANILIIDDTVNTRRALANMLELDRHQLTQAANGAEGIHCLLSGKFDLVITDILMAHGDGLEVLDHIAGMHNPPPVIAISGGNISMTADHALLIAKNKCDVVLKKPIDNDVLRSAVTRLLRARQAVHTA